MAEHIYYSIPAHIHALTGVGMIEVGARKVWVKDWGGRRIGTVSRKTFDLCGDAEKFAFAWSSAAKQVAKS